MFKPFYLYGTGSSASTPASATPTLTTGGTFTTRTDIPQEYQATIINYATLNVLAGASWATPTVTTTPTSSATASRLNGVIKVLLPAGFEGTVNYGIGFTETGKTQSFGTGSTTTSLAQSAVPVINGASTVVENNPLTLTIATPIAGATYAWTASEGSITPSGDTRSAVWTPPATGSNRNATVSVIATEAGKKPSTAATKTVAVTVVTLPYSIPSSLTFATGGTVTQAVHSSRIVQGYTGAMARIVKADRTLIADIGFKDSGLWNKEALEALDNTNDLFVAGVFNQAQSSGNYLPNGGTAGSEPLVPFRTAGVYSLAGIDYSKTTGLNTQSTTRGTAGFKVVGSASNALKFDLPDMSLSTGGGADAVEVFVSLMPHTRRATGTAIATADVGYQSATLASGTQVAVAKSGAIVNYWSVRAGVTGNGNLKQMRRLASGTADQYTVNKGVQNLIQKANCLEVYSTSMSRGAGSTQDQCNLYDLSQDLLMKSDLTNTVSTGNTTSNSTMSGSKIIFGGLPNAGLTTYTEVETLTLFGWVVVRNCTAETRKRLTLSLKRACNTDTLIAPSTYVQPIERLLFKDVTAGSGNLVGANSQLTMTINRSTPQKTLTPAGVRIKMNYTFTAGSPNMVTAVTPPYPLGTRDTSITAALTYTGFTANPVVTINNDGTFTFVSGGTWTTGTPTITLAGCYDMPPTWAYQDTQNAYGVQSLRSLADMNTANWIRSQAGTFLESLTEGTFVAISIRDVAFSATSVGNIGYDLVLSGKDPATYNTAVEANNIGARPTDESLSINWEEHSSQGWHRNNVALSLDVAGVKGVATTSIGIQVNVSEQAQEKYFDKLTGKPSIDPTVVTPETFDTKNNRATTQTQPTGVLNDNYALTNYGRSHHATPECRSYPQTSLAGSFAVVNERGVMLVSVGRFKNSAVFNASVTADDRYNNARTANAEANSFHLFAGNKYNHHFDYANNLGGASNFKALPNSILSTGVDGVGNLKGGRVLYLMYNKVLTEADIDYVTNNLDLIDSQFAIA